ncbi:MAG: PIG-L family deacetylase, partial [Acidobacteriota bacterium]|nr:PIG-L family deacetylase [Acidobacteriota bacterium]
NPHAFPELLHEGLEPHTGGVVWLAGTAPTMVVDITDHFERKVAALRQHVSQVGEREGLEEMIRTWTRTTAKMAGLKKGRLAEGFRVVITK